MLGTTLNSENHKNQIKINKSKEEIKDKVFLKNFYKDSLWIMVLGGIPLAKIDEDKFNEFFTKWFGVYIRSRTLYFKMLPSVKQQKIQNIQEEFYGKAFSLGFDNTSDDLRTIIFKINSALFTDVLKGEHTF